MQQIAPWVLASEKKIGASIYAVPSSERIEVAEVADAAGLWLHCDMILSQKGSKFSNTGVSVVDIVAISKMLPRARIDVHVIAENLHNYSDAVQAVSTALRDAHICRWSAEAKILTKLMGLRHSSNQFFQEIWAGRAGDGQLIPEADGGLGMLIRPGSKDEANPDLAIKYREIVHNKSLGFDGGITSAVAERLNEVKPDYLVIGRALFSSNSSNNC